MFALILRGCKLGGYFLPVRVNDFCGKNRSDFKNGSEEKTMGKIGIQELLIILALVLVIFGGGKLAGVGKALGTSIRDFKKEMSGAKSDADQSEVVAIAEEKTGGE